MYLALHKLTPCGLFAEILDDGQYHYGLLFTLPAGVYPDRVQKCSRLSTRSRHGTVQQWSLTRPVPFMLPGLYTLLIPRSWLILNGFLPLSVMWQRDKPAFFRREEVLFENFWLEYPEPNGLPLPKAA